MREQSSHKRKRFLIYCSDCDVGFDSIQEMFKHTLLPSHEVKAMRNPVVPFEDTCYDEDPQTPKA